MAMLGASSNAATIRAGQAFGRRDEALLRQGGAVAIALSMAFAACTIVLFLSLPEPLIALFLDPAEPARAEIVAVGTPEEVALVERSHTGRYLGPMLKPRKHAAE